MLLICYSKKKNKTKGKLSFYKQIFAFWKKNLCNKKKILLFFFSLYLPLYLPINIGSRESSARALNSSKAIWKQELVLVKGDSFFILFGLLFFSKNSRSLLFIYKYGSFTQKGHKDSILWKKVFRKNFARKVTNGSTRKKLSLSGSYQFNQLEMYAASLV